MCNAKVMEIETLGEVSTLVKHDALRVLWIAKGFLLSVSGSTWSCLRETSIREKCFPFCFPNLPWKEQNKEPYSALDLTFRKNFITSFKEQSAGQLNQEFILIYSNTG